MLISTKAASKQEGPKIFGVPDKKAVFFPYKRTAFLSGTPNFFGPSCFEAALSLFKNMLLYANSDQNP